MTSSLGGGTGAVRAGGCSKVHRPAESSTPVPVLPHLVSRLAKPYLELRAWSGAATHARHHATAVLWDLGLKELIEPVELVVSEIVTNSIRASWALASSDETEDDSPAIRFWLSVEDSGVLVLVWDASPSMPQQQELQLDAESDRGLLLVEMFSAAWGSFELANEPGKVVWALCQG